MGTRLEARVVQLEAALTELADRRLAAGEQQRLELEARIAQLGTRVQELEMQVAAHHHGKESMQACFSARMSSFPNEIISEILCHLPVKSLLRFRCVSKSWLSLIDNPGFIKMHLNRSLELKSADTNVKLILSGNSSLHSVSCDLLNIHMDAHPVSLNYPFKYDEYPVMGYCNGLFLLSCSFEFTLWNPSTRKHLKLPPFNLMHPRQEPQCCFYHVSFGYDRTTDDYKVVRITLGSCNKQSRDETLVYSLKSNSWRRIKEFRFGLMENIGAIFALGALFWVVFVPAEEVDEFVDSEEEDEFVIVAFDLGREEYDLLPLSQHLEMPLRVDLGVLDGCLSVSCNYNFDRVDIWLTREFGKRESWTKLLSLSHVDVNFSLKRNVKPIAYSRCGKYVILEKDKEQLLFYDLELKSVKKTWSHGPSTFSAFLDSGSLVQVKGGADEVGKNKDQAEGRLKRFFGWANASLRNG